MSLYDPIAGAERADGLLLVGHGSREPQGIEEFLATARLVARRVDPTPVEVGFLEFARPSIAEGFAALADRGVRRLAVVPLLLFSAGHAERDIPAALAAIASEYPRVAWRQSAHLGCHDALLALSKLRYLEALPTEATGADPDTALVLVGRGSHDEGATAEMHQFTRLRQQLTPVPHVRTAFMAMARPSLSTVLEDVATSGARRVVVQPHLLFAGVLMDRMREIVGDFARRYPRLQWLIAPHLGPSEQLVDVILDRRARLSWA